MDNIPAHHGHEQNPFEYLDFENVPQKMREANRWLICDRKKVPYYVTKRPRGVTDTPEDLSQLASFENAVGIVKKSCGEFGLGFALGADGTGNHFHGIDLDNVLDNKLSEIADSLPGYVEFSISGKGCHAYGYGQPFAVLGSNRSGIEAYSSGRYFLVTGNQIRGDLECLAQFVATRLVTRHAKVRSNISDAIARQSQKLIQLQPSVVTELRSALLHMRSDDYTQWIAMGLALHELGEIGRGIWLEWGALSEKFDPADAARKWNSFHPSATGYGAVFAAAQRQGWVNPSSNAAHATKGAIHSNNSDSNRTVVTRCGADIVPLAIT